MLTSGSFTKTDSVRQIVSMPGLMLDVKDRPIETPILKSYGEGLNTADYFNAQYGVRKGTVNRQISTQDSGALNKALLNVTRRLLVTIPDCNTNEGIEIDIDSKDVMDRALVNTIPGIGKRNDIVTGEIVTKAKLKD
jgi:DNA-directed RNA polymerase subunit beta'